jgi:sulfite reductase beta subunit-like hemoprotein
MAKRNNSGCNRCNGKTRDKRKMDCTKIAMGDLEKKTKARTTKTIEEFEQELEEKWRIYHELEVKQKKKNLRWFNEKNEDFVLVCCLVGLEVATVKRLFEESLLADNLKPMKRIYNY